MGLISTDLITIRKCYQRSGFDIRIVGGAVRDHLLGETPKDIDLCTDATPEESIAICRDNSLRFIETGLQHGTITVVLGGTPYEITSLRTEHDHNGRHATVQWTRDWVADLARRDLTINAMSMTLDGDLIDPFGGVKDLQDRRVRFVGDARQRMREDYLRILRWIRFHGRISPDAMHDRDAVVAAQEVAGGLRQISRERVWSEMNRMLAAPRGSAQAIQIIFDLGLSPHIDLPNGNLGFFSDALGQTSNPVSRLVALCGSETPDLGINWKWSLAEQKLASFLANNLDHPVDLEELIALRKVERDFVLELARLKVARGENVSLDDLVAFDPPVFPVGGKDLVAIGIKPGKALGEILERLSAEWTKSRFKLSKEELLAII